MLSKRSIQDASVAFFLNDMIDQAEFLEITNKRNPSFPYWKYDRIEGSLDDMSESETKAEFKPGFHIVVSVVSVVSVVRKKFMGQIELILSRTKGCICHFFCIEHFNGRFP